MVSREPGFGFDQDLPGLGKSPTSLVPDRVRQQDSAVPGAGRQFREGSGNFDRSRHAWAL